MCEKKKEKQVDLLCIKSHFCYRCGINSNYRSKLDTGAHLFDLERLEGVRGKAKPARKTERGKKDAETTIVLGNEAWSFHPLLECPNVAAVSNNNGCTQDYNVLS